MIQTVLGTIQPDELGICLPHEHIWCDQRLAPKADALYRIRVQGLVKGNQQIRVQLSSDEIPAGVTKEESTRVYADE